MEYIKNNSIFFNLFKILFKLKNYNVEKENIDMLLKDQYPISTDKEITIELLEKDKASANEETGVLTWKIDLKPNETKKFRISYKVRYPKDKIIDNL